MDERDQNKNEQHRQSQEDQFEKKPNESYKNEDTSTREEDVSNQYKVENEERKEPETSNQPYDDKTRNTTETESYENEPVASNSKNQEAPRQEANLESQATPQDKTKKPKQSKNAIGGFFKLLAAGVIGSAMTLGVLTQTDYFQPEQEAQVHQPESAAETTAEPVSTSDSVADITENASEAIVGIVNMAEQTENPFQQQNPDEEEVKKGVGSGVIYKVTDDEAYIVTNNHVIEGSSSIQVSLSDDEEPVDGEVVGADPLTDLAVVKIKGDYDITPLKFGDSDSLRSGDQVIAIGNPIGLDFSRTVTQGIVSAKDRTISVNTSAGKWDFDVIQTDAAINPGNSGGALINMQGELVGINSLKIASNGVEGLGFAIPSNQVQDLIKELADNGKIERPYMGVGLKSVSDIPRYYLQSLPEDVKDGAVVLSVDEESAAAEAGLKTEDVIVSIDGENVTNDNDLRSYLYKEAKIGDKVTLEVYRDGEKEKVELTLTSNEDAD